MVRRLIILLLLGSGAVNAYAGNCESIPKADARKHCLATQTNSVKHCHAIGSSDTRQLCLAQVERSPAHCRAIRSEARREQCLMLAR